MPAPKGPSVPGDPSDLEGKLVVIACGGRGRVPGSVVRSCAGCGGEVWLTPEGQVTASRHKCVLACTTCALRIAPNEPVKAVPGAMERIRRERSEEIVAGSEELLGMPLSEVITNDPA
jgi:hypothetical protein